MREILAIAAKTKLKAVATIYVCIAFITTAPVFAQTLDESANFLSGLEVRELLEEMTTLPSKCDDTNISSMGNPD